MVMGLPIGPRATGAELFEALIARVRSAFMVPVENPPLQG